VAIIILLDGNASQKIKQKKILTAWIIISEVYNLRRTNMSAVFGSYDGQLENTSSMSDVADVFRTHCEVRVIAPPGGGSAILKGAVMFRCDPDTIETSIPCINILTELKSCVKPLVYVFIMHSVG